MLKKTILAVLAGTALIGSSAAFADRDHRRHGRGHQHVVVKHHYVQHRPAVVHHYYRPQYAPVRHVVVHRPAPVVYHQPVYHRVDHTGAVIVAGAILGAVIGHHIATSY
jgi:hypothetical protein